MVIKTCGFMWFFRLIRWPNLLMIILTQVLLLQCIIRPFGLMAGTKTHVFQPEFMLLILISVLIAAAGYVINDYFDIEIDRINKPQKMILGVRLHPRKGMLVYWILNSLAFLAGFYLAQRLNSLNTALLFPVIAGLLWMYATRLKHSFLSGNVLVAFLSAFVVIIVWVLHLMLQGKSLAAFFEIRTLNVLVWFYAGFAFIVSLGREVIKDMEDMEGDREAGCKSLPLVLGCGAARGIALAISFLTMILLAWGQYLLLQYDMAAVFWYYMLVQAMLAWHIWQLKNSNDSITYHAAGNLSKIIMLAGILGMQLFCIAP
jgi:4-hydroxybenzoate polyprenyltransferase